LLLMDEPSEGLSPLLVQEVGDLIKDLNQQGTAILLVEQNLNFALEMADRVLILNKGAITFAGTAQDVVTDPVLCQQLLGVGANRKRGGIST
jgi:branched-chain amino acid transport system ATP-binding protein